MGEVNLNNKNVFVTGGNGFLGQALIKELLSLGAIVSSVDIQKESVIEGVDYYQVDISDYEKLKSVVAKINPSFIYHLAASLNRTRDFNQINEVFAVNVNGTINLLRALIDIDYTNFIFTSTSEVYGGNKIKPPFKEDDIVTPASPYSLSKYNTEMIIKTFSDLYSRNYTILRLFNFYGDNMPKNFFISQLIDKLNKNEDFDMTEGEQLRDYLYIDDIVKVLITSVQNELYGDTFNVCSGKGISIKEIAKGLKLKLNSKSKINFGTLPYRNNEVWEMVGDNSKLKKLANTDISLRIINFNEIK